jgi:phytoene synthase
VTSTVAEAYRECESITRAEARNFHYGIRLLPKDKRAALSAVYALARRIDDIGDGELPVETKRRQLAGVRAAIAAPGVSTDPVLVALADAAHALPIPMSAFEELIDGVEMDVDGRRPASFDDLVTYCRCVAGSIGRLCLGVFGARDMSAASSRADALGIALQQTNILRDVREDLRNGRVYLPADELQRFGVELRLDDADRLVDDGSLSELVAHCAARARDWYDDGLRLLPLLDRRSAASAAAMAGIYRRLLDDIAANPGLIGDRRMALSGWQKVGVAGRALAGAATRVQAGAAA